MLFYLAQLIVKEAHYQYNSSSIIELSGSSHVQRVHMLNSMSYHDSIVSQSASGSLAQISASSHAQRVAISSSAHTATLKILQTPLQAL